MFDESENDILNETCLTSGLDVRTWQSQESKKQVKLKLS